MQLACKYDCTIFFLLFGYCLYRGGGYLFHKQVFITVSTFREFSLLSDKIWNSDFSFLIIWNSVTVLCARVSTYLVVTNQIIALRRHSKASLLIHRYIPWYWGRNKTCSFQENSLVSQRFFPLRWAARTLYISPWVIATNCRLYGNIS